MTVRRKFEERLEAVRSDLLAEAYQVDVRCRTRAAVASARVKFRVLLYELGLSPHDDEVFTIKVEIDTKLSPQLASGEAANTLQIRQQETTRSGARDISREV